MVIIVDLHIILIKLEHQLFIYYKKIQISIYFILKLYFDHIIINIIKLSVCMHIIGKILEENLIYFIMFLSLVQIGLDKNLFYNIKMDADSNNNEIIDMVGNNYVIIL